MAGRIRARWKAASVTADQVLGTLQLDPSLPRGADHDVIASRKACVAQYTHGDSDLMLTGYLAHWLYEYTKPVKEPTAVSAVATLLAAAGSGISDGHHAPLVG
jgi:hypothetical protein